MLGEYLQAWVSSREAGDPTFHGWYLTGSWIVTGGNSRVYDRNVGYARRVPVSHAHGEVELVGRFGQVDLDDANVTGGILTTAIPRLRVRSARAPLGMTRLLAVAAVRFG